MDQETRIDNIPVATDNASDLAIDPPTFPSRDQDACAAWSGKTLPDNIAPGPVQRNPHFQ